MQPNPHKFTVAKNLFDINEGKGATLAQSLVPVDGKSVSNISIRNAKGQPNEEFYKWQFLYALISSGMYAKDYIGTEVRFPKGNKTSAPLRVDAVIFDSPDWLQHYTAYWQHKKSSDLEWLKAHLLAVVEFKRVIKKSRKL